MDEKNNTKCTFDVHTKTRAHLELLLLLLQLLLGLPALFLGAGQDPVLLVILRRLLPIGLPLRLVRSARPRPLQALRLQSRQPRVRAV